MAEHLSEFALEVQAVGDQPPDGHLQVCAQCRGRLQLLLNHSATVHTSAGYARTTNLLGDQLDRQTAAVGRKPLGWWLALFAVPGLAAAAFVLVRLSSVGGDESEVKGTPTVSVVQAEAHVQTHSAKPGDRVALRVGASGMPWLLIVAVQGDGAVDLLWPVAATQSGPAPLGVAALLTPEFTITPGSLTVLGVFSERPVSMEMLTKSLSGGVQGQFETLDLPGRFKLATWKLCVEGSPCRQ